MSCILQQRYKVWVGLIYWGLMPTIGLRYIDWISFIRRQHITQKLKVQDRTYGRSIKLYVKLNVTKSNRSLIVEKNW